MRSFTLFFLYIAGAYALAAVLSIPLTETIGVPQHKFIGRGGLLIAILGFWPFLKLTGLANKKDLGYDLPADRFRLTLGKGMLWGIAILTCLSLALLALEIRPIVGPKFMPSLPKVLLQGLLGGLAVAFIEETFFRGAMFSAIRRNGGGILSAMLLTSLLYALLHFFKPQALPPGIEPGPDGALTAYLSAFRHLFRWEHLDSFIALFLVGLFLALVRRRSGHIAWSIGLHAGWVLVIKITHSYTYYDEEAEFSYLAGSYDGMIGWLAAAWIGALCLIPWLLPKQIPVAARNGGDRHAN
jgi:membrane protease YdiL (CAAX protease family)